MKHLYSAPELDICVYRPEEAISNSNLGEDVIEPF